MLYFSVHTVNQRQFSMLSPSIITIILYVYLYIKIGNYPFRIKSCNWNNTLESDTLFFPFLDVSIKAKQL